MIIVKIQTP